MRMNAGKRALLCVLSVFMLLSGFVPARTANAAYAYGRGSWLDYMQGVRLSVFDLTTGTCAATQDFMSPQTYAGCTEDLGADQYGNIPASRNDVIYCKGCKLDYLMEYQSAGSTSLMDYKTESDAYMGRVSTEGTPISFAAVTPMIEVGGSEGEYYYDSENKFLKEMMKNNPGVFAALLGSMGFYFHEMYADADKTYLTSDYIIVIETVYWFRNRFIDSSNPYYYKWFYGTVTEWALYAEKTKGVEHVNKNAIRNADGTWSDAKGNAIHCVMGVLTCKSAPVSAFPRKDRILSVNGTPLHIKAVAENSAIGAKRQLNDCVDVIDRAATCTEIDNTIMEYFGADYLAPNELYPLSVEIVNKEFHAGTDAVLSFKVESNGETQFAPAYSDIVNYDGDPNNRYYGIKLSLQTTWDSDIKLGDIELYCDGLPSLENTISSVYSYIYDEWSVPDRVGDWKFTVRANSGDGSRIPYHSNSGVPVDPEDENTDYYFTITVTDPQKLIRQPEDTNADDKRPAGFTMPTGELVGHEPRNTLSWRTYSASTWVTADGEQKVWLTPVEHTKTISMDGTSPVSYGNIASAYTDRSGTLVTKSGYGIGVDAKCSVSGDHDGLSGGYQYGVALYPEYEYSGFGSLLEENGSGGLYLQRNAYSKYYADTRNDLYSRVHFTPVWYPDGEYNIQVFLFDSWTPAGMLWDCRTYTVKIDGSMYDDWYVTRR